MEKRPAPLSHTVFKFFFASHMYAPHVFHIHVAANEFDVDEYERVCFQVCVFWSQLE